MTISIALAALAAAQAAAPQASPEPMAVAPASTNPAESETLTNKTVIDLVEAGLGAETIVAKIRTSKGGYDTSTTALIRLKQAGVPDSVMAAMLDRSKASTSMTATSDDSNPNPLAPHSPGIYLLDRGGAKMVRLSATSSNQVKTSNYWGFALTGGLSSMKKKLVIPNRTARTQSTHRRPTFYFYFGKPGVLADLTGFNSNVAVSASSPNEFSLVRLEQNKNHREAAIGSINIISRVKSGVSDKARVPFTYDDVAPGVFRLTPETDLEPGEYGFIASIAAGTDRDVIARIFDFSVN